MNLVSTLARRRVALGFLTAAATIVFSRPTWATWGVGLAVALAGESMRIWAAGHLEKGREVTRSGPYRLTRHPLYLGSAFVALGVVIASRSAIIAVLVTAYLSLTLSAAIRTEEAFLSQAFGDDYARYREARAEPMTRRFSVARAARNREYRAVAGVIGGFALLALKAARYL